jgi:dTDP-glucose pyrophosphorylase
MILIIPLGGLGLRFKNLGYNSPKPLIKILGKELICWILDNLNLTKVSKIVIPYNQDLEKYRFEDFLKHKYEALNCDWTFIKLDKQTEGACDTLLSALNTLTNTDLDQKIMSCDGDNFFLDDVISLYLNNNNTNSIFYFVDTNSDPIYSYLQLNNTNIIQRFVEKEKISNNACCGIYCFESGHLLKKYCTELISKNIRQKGEFYLSLVVNLMINSGVIFNGIQIPASKFICLGTPLQVKCFCNNIPKIPALYTTQNQNSIKKLRLCFNLYNTLITYPKQKNNINSIEPITNNINFIKYLSKLGHTIIIYTTGSANKHTFDILDKLNIPYDEIYFDKPVADFYIDDNTFTSSGDLEKELGFYQSKITPRDFHELTGSNIETYVKKTSNLHGLDGEIYWYLNIPNEIKDMFPFIIRYDTDNNWYEMEKIHGIPVSKIYLAEEVTTELLGYILSSLSRIHGSKTSDNIDIYTNYDHKLKQRYLNYDYSRFNNSSILYEQLLTFFDDYKINHRGYIACIHGDPVMTNIMINQFGKIKFLDMRGKLDNITSIFGDANYDYAKLYQSLIGYDEILENKHVNIKYKTSLISYFEEYITSKFGLQRLKDIKKITQSLLFTLIPLHDNSKCIDYYNLCIKIDC